MTMTRRAFMAAPLAAWLPAAAQPSRKYRIGYLTPRAVRFLVDDYLDQALSDSGYVNGGNTDIVRRFAANDAELLQSMARELATSPVDVIVCDAVPAIRAAMGATRSVPIVVLTAIDPIATGLVPSLAHPGGNVTGVHMMVADLSRKRLQLIAEMVPVTTRLCVLGGRAANAPYFPGDAFDTLVKELRAACGQMGIAMDLQVVVDAEELPSAFMAIKRFHPQALCVLTHSLTVEHRNRIIAMATQEKLADIYEGREFVVAGGLMSYGPDVREAYRRAVTYVDRILRGAAPGDLAIEQPTKLEVVVNSAAAKARGLTIPASIRLRADEVIQ